MSSDWTNEYIINRDLSIVQGCLPVDVDKTIAADQKPPTPLIIEDTEEEFFRDCMGGGEFAAPDFGLISHYLDLVRDVKISSDSENVEKVIQISKLNASAPEFALHKKPETRLSHDSHVKPVIQNKEKKIKDISYKRNVAVTSILENIAKRAKDKIEEVSTVKTQALTTLLKANEPQQSQNITDSVEKVSCWLNSNQKVVVTPYRSKTPLLIDPQKWMFKKKVTASPLKQAKEPVIKSPPSVSTNYKPTAQALEYYKKYLEKSQLKSQITEDIWSKAEREMKEIDARRKREAEESMQVSPCSTLTLSEADGNSDFQEAGRSSSSREADTSDGSPQADPIRDSLEAEPRNGSQEAELSSATQVADRSDGSREVPSDIPLVFSSDPRADIVKLPQHRHMLTGECVVCEALSKKTFRDAVRIRKM